MRPGLQSSTDGGDTWWPKRKVSGFHNDRAIFAAPHTLAGPFRVSRYRLSPTNYIRRQNLVGHDWASIAALIANPRPSRMSELANSFLLPARYLSDLFLSGKCGGSVKDIICKWYYIRHCHVSRDSVFKERRETPNASLIACTENAYTDYTTQKS